MSSQNPDVHTLGLEVGFSINHRRADMVAIDTHITGYEIKGELDSLQKLSDQIQDYIKRFNQVYLVMVEKHLEQTYKHIPPSVGIIVYKQNAFDIIKRPTVRKKLSKPDMLECIPIQWIKAHTTFKSNCAYTIRQNMTNNLSKKDVQRIWHDWLVYKYKEWFDSFIQNDRGNITHTEDLYILSSGNNKIFK